ncbi:MAG: haloacid dehalogenase-like hydrolase [Firmicutes bacterium]|nr:haloacid dehalogenase-like hydrolase [Bacillota bacterium]MCD7799482.1 haloacid dehalogenase-like hydrolase [Akkermansiaceae bacterium]
MNKQPIIAICYDFDKTLSPDDMQAQGYIQSVGYSVDDFWKESNELASSNKMDQNLAYMYMMSNKSRGRFFLKKDTLQELGSKVELFPGVDTWFDRINNYGKLKGVNIEHYIISSGLKEMIEGTKIADKFEQIYACSFYYDSAGVAVWPAQSVNYTNKTQFLFRIEKGVLEINDQRVNAYFTPEQYRVPFRNIIYIGDSDTDIPCMKLVNVHGGHSIGVYNSETGDKTKVFRMLEENRIKYYAPADYTENSILEDLVKKIIDRTLANEMLESIHFECVRNKNSETASQSKGEIKKDDLINLLEDSTSFFNTHSVIKLLNEIADFSFNQKCKLIKCAIKNSQIRYILNDPDLRDFYKRIVDGINNDEANIIRTIINNEKKR